jgi:DNA-binding SARP family transcriptional activator/tetratricopeptide (TPR) repeat protein
MERFAIRLLGPPSTKFDGAAWDLPSPTRCLIIMGLLTSARDGAFTRSALASLLWPDELDPQARANLRRHLHRLQHGLPPVNGVEWLLTDNRSVRWNLNAPAWIDVRAFQDAAADPSRAAEAVALYRGDFLEGIHEEYVIAERLRLHALYVATCREAALAARRDLHYDEAIRFADRIVAADEWREDALRLGMTLRYESGDRTSALAQFERFSTRLSAEMGVDPMPETLALRDSILMNAATPATPGAAGAATEEPDEAPRDIVRTPFVGRIADRATLDTAWRRAARGRGTTLFIRGEAGIGKTRLVSEFASAVGLQGGRTLVGETSHPQAYPYEPILAALRRALPFIVESPVGSPWLEALAEVLPELQAAFPDLRPSEPLEVDTARPRLFEAIARTIEHLARTRPLLLVVEDLHWAQSATLDAVEALVRRTGGAPVLIVATIRTGEVETDRALHAMCRRLQGEQRATALALGALEESDVEELVRKVSHAADLSGTLASAIYRRSDGNPLFAGQLLRIYLETGGLPAGAIEAGGIAEAILGRVAALDAAVQTLAQTAAAIGRSFTTDLLAGALGWDESEVLDALGVLLDRGLVRTSGGSMFAYTFTHALVAAAIYESISAPERTGRHRRIAALMSRVGGEDRQALASIARHWELGGEPERAARTYTAAAQGALTVYARDEAIELARTALRLVSGARERFEALRLIAISQRRAADQARWESDLMELARTAGELGAEEQFVADFEWTQYFQQIGDRTAQRMAIEVMLARSRDLDPTRREIALRELGLLETQIGALQASIAPLDEALAIACATGNHAAEAENRLHLYRALLKLGRDAEVDAHFRGLQALGAIDRSPEVLRHLFSAQESVANATNDFAFAASTGQEMLDLAERCGDEYLRMDGHNLLAFASNWLASASEVRRHLQAAIAISKRLGYEHGLAKVQINLATYEVSVGLAQRALAIVDDAIGILARMDAKVWLCTSYCVRSDAYAVLGDHVAALAAAVAADDIATTIGVPWVIAETRSALGREMCATGDYDRGLAILADAVAMRREGNPVANLMLELCTYLIALLDARRIDPAIACAAELGSLFEQNPGMLWNPTRAYYALARAARAGGDAIAADVYTQRGRAVLAGEIERLGDEESVAAYRELRFNRGLADIEAPKSTTPKRSRRA